LPQEAHYVYVVVLHETGDVKGAIRTLKQAAGLHPTDRDILSALVQYAVKSGDNATAAEYAAKLKALQG
jgi:predicted TPR repeat methyltransferase